MRNDFALSAVTQTLHCAYFVVARWGRAFVCSQLKIYLIKSSRALRGKASAQSVSHGTVYRPFGRSHLRKQLSDPIATVVRGDGRAATSD